ncbi:hypothetical protein [Pseudomonas lundensis]|uniref:hypothetical protein n=1 Tax=Pseudomonas lundensis TaxID=86185 RepID=UPI001E4826E8|nr:hypothetical protein [Pseudomonas lundensis]
MTQIESIQTNRLIQRSYAEPVRSNLSWHETWEGPDSGLIKTWEIGRKLAIQNPNLASKTLAGELPPLNWKGGSDRTLVKREKFGSLRYLAQWQGLRGEDLSINLDADVTIKCVKTHMIVTFTPDLRKILNDSENNNIEEGALNGGLVSGVSEQSLFQ